MQAPEKHGGGERHDERERQHPDIDAGVFDAWNLEVLRQHRREQRTGPARQQDAERGTGEREHHAFGQQLLGQPPASGAERPAQGELVPARHVPRQHQVGHIRTGNQEHQSDDAQEDQQAGPRIPHLRMEERDHLRTGISIRRRIPLGDATGDRLHFRLRRRRRNARAQPAQGSQEVVVTVRIAEERGVNLFRCPDGEAEARWHHPDNRERLLVVGRPDFDPDSLTERVGAPGKMPLPYCVAQHDHLAPAIDIFRSKGPSDDGRHVQDLEEIGCRLQSRDPFGQIAAGQRDVTGCKRRHPGEGRAFGSPVFEVGIRRDARYTAGVRSGGCDLNQALGVGERKRAEEHGVDDAEQRGIDADAKRQCPYGYACERAMPAQRSDGVSNVLRNHVEDRQPALLPVDFLDLLDSTELAPRRSARVGRREAAAHVFVDQQVEVDLNLLAQFGVVMPLRKQGSQTGREFAQPRHDAHD